jgi:hypothetical protein
VVWITNELGQVMFQLSTHETGTLLREIPGEGEVRCTLLRCPLRAGQYSVNIWADIAREPLDCVEPAFELVVQEGDFFRSGQARLPGDRSVLVDHSWLVVPLGADGEGTRRPLALSDARKA